MAESAHWPVLAAQLCGVGGYLAFRHKKKTLEY